MLAGTHMPLAARNQVSGRIAAECPFAFRGEAIRAATAGAGRSKAKASA